MKKISDTGHGINLRNLKKTIDICKKFGSQYAPSNPAIQIQNMLMQYQTAKDYHESMITVLMKHKLLIHEREQIFKGLGKKITQVLGIVGSIQASDAYKKEVKMLADKIRGFNLYAKKERIETTGASDDTDSHLSYEIRTENYKKLISLLAASAFYIPNETELTVQSLTEENEYMGDLHEHISKLMSLVKHRRSQRNYSLYHPVSGVLSTVKACKSYVKGIYGTGSPEYKLISAVKLRALPKKAMMPSKV